MLAELKELWKFRELLLSLVQRELRVRYKNSFFGFFWSLINPAATVIVMYVVFRYIFARTEPNLSAYILVAYLPYMSFQLTLMDCAQSVLSNTNLIKKMYFPREVLPLSMVISNFIHFLLSLLVLFAFLFLVWIRDPADFPIQSTVMYLPILLGIHLMLTTGLGLLLSALNVFYEDVKYLTAIALYLTFFLCPIMYFAEMVKYSTALASRFDWAYTAYNLNPIAALSNAYRKVILAPQPVRVGPDWKDPLPIEWNYIALTGFTSLALLVIGYITFNRLKWRFVERS